MIHQPSLAGGSGGQATDLEIQAREVLRMREWLEHTWAKHTNKTPDDISRDIERDLFLTASEAKDYGLVDEVLESRKIRPSAITR
jgi:ATP-dependent Clp protease protease subunit